MRFHLLNKIKSAHGGFGAAHEQAGVHSIGDSVGSRERCLGLLPGLLPVLTVEAAAVGKMENTTQL